jgi:uncharacterized protein YndB with AHSA1/START domain
MATWAEFAEADPGLAAFALERMQRRIVYQATLRLDGGPRVHPVSPWLAAGLLCVSFRDTSPKIREVARDPRYALHTAQPWDDHAGTFGELMLRGRLEPLPASHPAVVERPGQTPYGLVHYACSVDEVVATEYSDDELPEYRRWRSSGPGLTLELGTVVWAPPDEVFRMLTEPERLERWWGPRGFATAVVQLELTVGGRYRFAMRPPDGEPFHLSGEYVDIDPPSRLAYTFVWDPPAPDDRETTVRLGLRQRQDGTELSLSQGLFATEERRALHRDGWTESFERLREVIGPSS